MITEPHDCKGNGEWKIWACGADPAEPGWPTKIHLNCTDPDCLAKAYVYGSDITQAITQGSCLIEAAPALLDAARVVVIGLKDHAPCEGRDNNNPCTLCWIEGTAQAALKKVEREQ